MTPSTIFRSGNILTQSNSVDTVVLNAPAQISETVVGLLLISSLTAGFGGLVPSPDTNNQSYFLKAARYFCPYADGLVINSMPGCSVWIGKTVPASVLTFLSLQFVTLNEWLPVNKPMPRNTLPGVVYPCFAVQSGTWDFLTISVNPAYNSNQLKIYLELEISTSSQ